MAWASSILGGTYNNGSNTAPPQVNNTPQSPIKQLRTFLSLSSPNPQETCSASQKQHNDTPQSPSNREEDGRGWVSQLSDTLIFHVSLGYNLVKHNKDTQPWWDEITKGIILGALPFHDRNHRTKLIDSGVGGVVILCKDYELGPNLLGTPVKASDWNEAGVETLHLPTQDFTAPTQAELQTAVDFMTRIINEKKNVYVHCKAGRGRSVACVVCYCVVHLGMTAHQAVQFVQTKRSHINMGAGQFRACEEYEKNYRKKQATSGDDSSPSSFTIAGVTATATETSSTTAATTTATTTATTSVPGSHETGSEQLVASSSETDFILVAEEEWLAQQEIEAEEWQENEKENEKVNLPTTTSQNDDDEWEEVTGDSDTGYGVGVDELTRSQSLPNVPLGVHDNNRLEGVEDFEVISKKVAEQSNANVDDYATACANSTAKPGLVTSLFKNAMTALTSYTTTTATTTQTAQTARTHAPHQWPPVFQDQYCDLKSENSGQSPSTSPRSTWNPNAVSPAVEVEQM